jgi:hypothetical protein
MAAYRVIFFINKEVHILDLAGALQVFYEAARDRGNALG